jgi:hypothetical protein
MLSVPSDRIGTCVQVSTEMKLIVALVAIEVMSVPSDHSEPHVLISSSLLNTALLTIERSPITPWYLEECVLVSSDVSARKIPLPAER